PDSLKLDYTYRLSAYITGNYWHRYDYDASFSLEDYQLDEVAFRFNAEKSSLEPQASPVLIIAAVDANGMPVPDARAAITLLPAEIFSGYRTEVVIPDTLWTQTVFTDESGEVRITVPAS